MHWRWSNWAVFNVTTEALGETIAVDPGRRFVFSWGNGSGETASTVTMTFEPIEGGTQSEWMQSVSHEVERAASGGPRPV